MADGGQPGTGLAISGGGAGGAMAMAGNLRGRLVAMPEAKRNKWIVSVLVLAALGAGMAWYVSRPDWRVLFSGLDAKDVQQIAQELAGAGIAYNMTDDGSGIEVDAGQMDKARIEVATKGMPQSGRMGFELFDKPNWVGSEFDEKVNYQRAMEGELEHTIGTLDDVRSARVHLVLPKESLFGEGERAAKASVVLQLKRRSMVPDQVEAIRSLVAGAVENLDPSNVTLVDADGRVSMKVPGQGSASGDAERQMEDKLVAMLEPTAGIGNVRATVNVAYDDSTLDKTDDVYDPSQTAALSLHKSEQTSASRARAAGVPGTVSNTPGAAAAGSVQGAAPAAAATPGAPVPPLMQTANAPKAAALPVYPQSGAAGDGGTMTEETGSYAVTRHLLHTEQGPGRIRRVSVAVVVNDRMSSEGAGKLAHTVWKPRSTEEMQRLEQVARAAVGFDTTRGDQVVIENMSFSSNIAEPPLVGAAKVMDQTEGFLHSQPGLLKTVSLSVLALVLMMGVLKPMLRQVTNVLSQPAALAQAKPGAQQGQAQVGPGHAMGQAPGQGMGQGASMPSLASLIANKRPTDSQAIHEHISGQIRREPAQSTRLLESWINAPEEEV